MSEESFITYPLLAKDNDVLAWRSVPILNLAAGVGVVARPCGGHAAQLVAVEAAGEVAQFQLGKAKIEPKLFVLGIERQCLFAPLDRLIRLALVDVSGRNIVHHKGAVTVVFGKA